MKATIDGIKVEGTVEEIVQYQKLMSESNVNNASYFFEVKVNKEMKDLEARKFIETIGSEIRKQKVLY